MDMQLAEARAEGLVLFDRELLVAEEDDLVLQQSVVDRRDGPGVEVPGQPYAVDAGANVGPEFHHINGFSHGSISAAVRRDVNRLADRDPKSGVAFEARQRGTR